MGERFQGFQVLFISASFLGSAQAGRASNRMAFVTCGRLDITVAGFDHSSLRIKPFMCLGP